MQIKKIKDFLNENNDYLKKERKYILDFLGLQDWNIFVRKYFKPEFSKYRYRFELYIRGYNSNSFEKWGSPKVSIHFLDKYKDTFPRLIKNALNNPNYTEKELITIIESFPDYIDWYYIFYNDNIPLEYKKQHYKEIYNDFIKSFDIRVPISTRIKETEKTLNILK